MQGEVPSSIATGGQRGSLPSTLPSSAMQFYTVKEAARRTGKSPSSIRRILYPILRDPAHPDRSHIEPGIEEAQQLRLRGDSFAWRVSDDLLSRALPEASPEQGREHAKAQATSSQESDLVAVLRRELEIKNQQITQHAELVSRQMELLNALSERLREGNILMASLQQRLTLVEKNPIPNVVDGDVTTGKTKTTPPPKSPSPVAKAKKKGFFSRLFH